MKKESILSTYIIRKAPKYRILHLTDMHLFADPNADLLGINTRNSYLSVLDAIKKRNKRYDLVICSGDITQDHTLAAYQYFEESLRVFNTPCFWTPGNHDEPDFMDKIDSDILLKTYHHVLLGENWSIILLNSRVDGAVHGALSDKELTFLETCLTKNNKRNTLIALHHHSFSCGCLWLDHIGLRNKKPFFEKIAKHQQVKMVICGHIHQDFKTYWKETAFLSTPSTCFQFKPNNPEFCLDHSQPGFREIELTEAGEITTSVYRLPPNSFLPREGITGY